MLEQKTEKVELCIKMNHIKIVHAMSQRKYLILPDFR